MTIIPGIYKDLAPQHQHKGPLSHEIITVLGSSTHETNKEDVRVIIQRTCPSGSPKLEHLTLKEFAAHVNIKNHEIPRFAFVQANHFQD